MRDRQEFQGNELYKGRRYKITWVRRKKQDSFPKIIHFYSPKEWKKKQPDFSFSNLLDPTTGLDSHVRVLYCSSIFQHSVHGINDIWNNNESNPSFRLCLLVILNFLIFNFFTARREFNLKWLHIPTPPLNFCVPKSHRNSKASRVPP